MHEFTITSQGAALVDAYQVRKHNSIDVAPDGDLPVCSRNTWTVYKNRPPRRGSRGAELTVPSTS